jgi:hypothetical protein
MDRMMWLAFINLRQDANQDWKDASIFIQGYKLLYLASHQFFFQSNNNKTCSGRRRMQHFIEIIFNNNLDFF